MNEINDKTLFPSMRALPPFFISFIIFFHYYEPGRSSNKIIGRGHRFASTVLLLDLSFQHEEGNDAEKSRHHDLLAARRRW